MKKRTYIQPEMNVELFRMEALMLPTSPTDGSMDPKVLMPTWRPRNLTRTPVF